MLSNQPFLEKGTTCLSAGIPRGDIISKYLSNANNLRNWGVSLSGPKRVELLQIKLSGKSARLQYGDDKEFQIGNGLKRSIIRSREDKSDYLRQIVRAYNNLDPDVKASLPMDLHMLQCLKAYFSEVLMAFKDNYHYFVDKGFFVEKESNIPEMDEVMESFERNLHIASNTLDNRESRMHLHLDTPSNFPTILTKTDIMENEFKGGELFILDNSFLCNYKCGDIVLIPGSKVFHSVLPFSIDPNLKGISHQNPLRFSCSIYNNKN